MEALPESRPSQAPRRSLLQTLNNPARLHRDSESGSDDTVVAVGAAEDSAPLLFDENVRVAATATRPSSFLGLRQSIIEGKKRSSIFTEQFCETLEKENPQAASLLFSWAGLFFQLFLFVSMTFVYALGYNLVPWASKDPN
uniref:Uncharacterized protein n=1 Tax=Chromera velia CCMP2878 TaxID=1169474 RepID=A0A0G4HYA6_9ALVE|eukprot:Cvel_33499.t1-p1 / transcript=Cvel_33499.t1 / gene=Cvel_33499 / organism=Chromera_velia_CCMP2878 / gene_product=hypothetical protein / transcript_product=hypothetical protein / location=Cvel_scaffold5457:2893-3312(+) / protein_length=140 / sequence_SO=supercontig / SO=protein_coding / is_pseudo=false